MTTKTIAKTAANLVTADFYTAFDWDPAAIKLNLDTFNFVHEETGTVMGNFRDLKDEVVFRINKLNRAAAKEERAKLKHDMADEALAILTAALPDAEVFINRSSPNVKLGGIHFYVMLGKETLNYGNNITFVVKDMPAHVLNKHLTQFRVRSHTETGGSKEANSVMLDSGNYSIDDIAAAIDHIAGRVGEL